MRQSIINLKEEPQRDECHHQSNERNQCLRGQQRQENTLNNEIDCLPYIQRKNGIMIDLSIAQDDNTVVLRNSNTDKDSISSYNNTINHSYNNTINNNGNSNNLKRIPWFKFCQLCCKREIPLFLSLFSIDYEPSTFRDNLLPW